MFGARAPSPTGMIPLIHGDSAACATEVGDASGFTEHPSLDVSVSTIGRPSRLIDPEAGPSDWYQRSMTPPSPPSTWREPSSNPDACDTPEGPSDIWTASRASTPIHSERFFRYQSFGSSIRSADSADRIHPADNLTEHGGKAQETGVGDDDHEVAGQMMSPTLSLASVGEHATLARAAIAPAISRLRSHHRSVSSSTVGSIRPPRGHSRTPSLLSQLPRSTTPDDPSIAFHPLRQLSAELKGAEPTVVDVRAVISIGTRSGHVLVYTFDQGLKYTLGTAITAQSGPVTAIRISSDHTYIAVGHASGNIHLWDLASPGKPARTVLAAPPDQIVSGHKEGHARGDAIQHINFVGSRHTAILSGDAAGKVHWWSLGRIMRLESTDVIRILGSAKRSRLFAALPLPLGAEHSTDSSQLAALLTARKLVIVRLKPTPKTLHRRFGRGSSGCAAWLPAGEHGPGSDPVLAYSWDEQLHFLRAPSFVEGRSYSAPGHILAIDWFDPNHVLLIMQTSIILLDVRSNFAVEDVPFTSSALLSSTVYREKIFVLTKTSLQAGSLRYWNDKILASVHRGDFLGAVQQAIDYHKGIAPGNHIALPSKPAIAERIRDLLSASLKWAFSEERMRDDTHFSTDGRGVDLTETFEGLATSTIEACLAIEDMILLEDAFEAYGAAGIHGIFLGRVQGLDTLERMPPAIVKALISYHADRSEFSLAEYVIWSVDPLSLDINQAVSLCEVHHLWDALVHIYNRALQDFVTPIAKLLGPQVEPTTVYAYLEAILSGVSYPTAEPLPQPEVAQAAIYEAILGDYFPHLLANTELFLHVLDLAFEQSYLNESSSSRQVIINMLLDHSADTFVYIFVARNLPKYPQFISLPPSTLDKILYALSTGESDTTEDRQLAVEYLLSAYRSHDTERTIRLFQQAGFNRILSKHYREHNSWKDLATLSLRTGSPEVFETLRECFARDRSTVSLLQFAVSDLLDRDIRQTGDVIDNWSPGLHDSTLGGMDDERKLQYLSHLLEPDNSALLPDHKHQYVSLLRRYQPEHVIGYLQGATGLEIARIAVECERDDYTPGLLWALERQGDPNVFRVAGQHIQQQCASLCEAPGSAVSDARLHRLTETCDMAVQLARKHPSENTWFDVLYPLIETVQAVSKLESEVTAPLQQTIQSILQHLISSGASFPRLVKRLVDETSVTKTAYPEFRSILAGMLDSYRVEAEILMMGKNLFEADLFVLVEKFASGRQKGWPRIGT